MRTRKRLLSVLAMVLAGVILAISDYPLGVRAQPVATTLPANFINSSSAILNGSVNPGNVSTTAWFQWGTTTNYGNATPPINVGNANAPVAITNQVAIVYTVPYHFRAVASNSVGVVYGSDQGFTAPFFQYPYYGNGDTSFGGAMGQGTLSLQDNGVNIYGTLTVGPGTFNDILVIYIDTGSGGFSSTAGFADGADPLRKAISGFDGGANRSVLAMQWGFKPGYAIALGPQAAGSGGLYQLNNGGNNSLTYLGSVNLAPLTNNSSSYSFSFSVNQIGMTNYAMATFRFLGTYVRTNGFRSDEALPGNVTGVPGWNSFVDASLDPYTVEGGSFVPIYRSPDAAYTWTTLAGSAGVGSADGVGSAAQFSGPDGISVDRSGNLYVADYGNYTIRKITPAGVVSTIAGLAGYLGIADGTNSSARFYGIWDTAVDTAGNIYVTDGATLRKITPSGTNWVVTTIAGSASSPGGQDGTNGTAQLGIQSLSLAVDGSNNLYVADSADSTIRKVTPMGTNWVVTTIAGTAGILGGADGTNGSAQFHYPSGVTVDQNGNVYVADWYTVRKVAPVGTNWIVTTIAGSAGNPGYLDGTNGAARFHFENDRNFSDARIAVDTNGNLYVTDLFSQAIRKISPVQTNWVVTTMAGGVQGSANGTGTNASFNQPSGITVDTVGNVYVTEVVNDDIRKINPATVVSTIAGQPNAGAGSVDGTGNTARFNSPAAVAADQNGNVYVADELNYTLRQITSAGEVSTIAGLAGKSGTNDGAGSLARFGSAYGVAVDTAGNSYVADSADDTIRKITPFDVVSTIAGLAGTPGSVDGTNGAARFYYPRGVTVDTNGNIYVADAGNYTIRKIVSVGTNWVVTTIAGLAGSAGDADGTNAAARFGNPNALGTPSTLLGPNSLAVDNASNLFVADLSNGTIRKISPNGTNWVVTTIAGRADRYAIGAISDGTNDAARFIFPNGIAVDNVGDLFVCDFILGTIEKLTPFGTNWVATTIGGGLAYGSTDGSGSAAEFLDPAGITVDPVGNIYVADIQNNTIRKGVYSYYGVNNSAAYPPPVQNASLSVTLVPPVGGWRLPWELSWHNSGDTVSNLAAGNYSLVFETVPGYLSIQTNTLVPVPGGATFYTNQYYPTSGSGGASFGSLAVTLTPGVLAGTGWRFFGESGWRASGSQVTNLVPNLYYIQFEPVSGYATPSSQAIPIYGGLNTSITAGYLLAQSKPANVLTPVAVPANEIPDVADYPFGFNGQIQSDTGYGSGVVVVSNVVLTAAHVVFNDETLSYVSQAFWYPQEEVGTYQPQPQAARGWFILSGYAAQRTNDIFGGLAPGQSSPQSRDLDVAALYFSTPPAGGGYAGYLPSDANPNTWLTGNALKMLVGYPVDGSLFGDTSIIFGDMFQTQPQPYPLGLDTDPVSDQQVYTANWFLSYPGNSGGPLEVQYNGTYYPAAVYLGTLFSGTQPVASAVRAIDGAVASMITNAQAFINTGTNGTGGGAINFNSGAGFGSLGYLQWQLGPPSAIQAGAAWQLMGDSSYSTATNYTESVNGTNAVTARFKTIPGWHTPSNQTVTPLLGQVNAYSAIYTVSNPVMAYKVGTGLGFYGTTGTLYRIDVRTNLALGSWTPFSTNTITNSTFNLLIPRNIMTNKSGYYRAVWLQQ